MCSSSGTLRALLILILVLINVVEMCSNIATSSGSSVSTDAPSTTKAPTRKRRASELIELEFLGSSELSETSKLVEKNSELFSNILQNSRVSRQIGANNTVILKYLLNDVDCLDAQKFARSVKETTNFVSGANIRCDGKIIQI